MTTKMYKFVTAQIFAFLNCHMIIAVNYQKITKPKTTDKLDSLAASKSLPAYALPVYSTAIAAIDIYISQC